MISEGKRPSCNNTLPTVCTHVPVTIRLTCSNFPRPSTTVGSFHSLPSDTQSRQARTGSVTERSPLCTDPGGQTQSEAPSALSHHTLPGVRRRAKLALVEERRGGKEREGKGRVAEPGQCVTGVIEPVHGETGQPGVEWCERMPVNATAIVPPSIEVRTRVPCEERRVGAHLWSGAEAGEQWGGGGGRG